MNEAASLGLPLKASKLYTSAAKARAAAIAMAGAPRTTISLMACLTYKFFRISPNMLITTKAEKCLEFNKLYF